MIGNYQIRLGAVPGSRGGPHSKSWPLALLLVGLALTGCIDERIVYRDQPLFADPPSAAVGFLGYSDTTSRRTTCGNCHAGQQARWKTSAHATAVADLVASGHSQTACFTCHTVSDKGNAATGTVAYDATRSPRYHDVQCESCHSAGLTHVQDPSATQPLARIAVGDTIAGCNECHRDTHHPFYDEWKQSRHSRTNPDVASRKATNPTSWASCAYCHEGKEALRVQFSSRAEFLEKSNDQQYGITCAVCHDPHGSAETGQLRASIETRNPDENLCIKCHHKRAEPDESGRGAHSAQGPMVLGEAGWRPPNFVYSNLRMETTHGSDRNPKLCAGCHLNKFTVTDANGGFVISATGHLFKAIPCLDAAGKPTGAECDITAPRTFRSCTASGCHGTENAARSAIVTTEVRLRNLTNEVNRLVAQVPAGEFSTSDGRTTVGEGAKFNASLLDGDTSRGVHNPFLLEALLQASIDALKTTYGIN
jgi:predicted CXXCH cytochrome family protein